MKGLPLLLNGMSGSLGGLTFSHNAGGAYVRARGIPTQPNTPAQTVIKGVFGTLSTAWRATLTAAQRDDWDLYGAATPLIDALGNPFFPTGLNMYIRGNTSLLQAEHPRVDAGPITPGLPTLTAPSSSGVVASTNVATINFNSADAWDDVDSNFLFIYASRGQGASINFFKGPYQLAGVIEGNSGAPPTNPGSVTVPFNIAVGQRVFFRATLIDEQGRKSQNFFFSSIAA